MLTVDSSILPWTNYSNLKAGDVFRFQGESGSRDAFLKLKTGVVNLVRAEYHPMSNASDNPPVSVYPDAEIHLHGSQ